jgi:hypothetical protein
MKRQRPGRGTLCHMPPFNMQHDRLSPLGPHIWLAVLISCDRLNERNLNLFEDAASTLVANNVEAANEARAIRNPRMCVPQRRTRQSIATTVLATAMCQA